MRLYLLSSNGMVQRKHVLDPGPHLVLKVEPNGSPPIMILHRVTFHEIENGNVNHVSIFATTLHLTYIHSRLAKTMKPLQDDTIYL